MDSQQLRDLCSTLRRTPKPLSDIIPILQEAADEIDKLRAEIEVLKDEWLNHDCYDA